MLSAERFDAAEALRLGLVHEVVAETELDDRVDTLVDTLLAAGPAAQAAAKDLVLAVAGQPIEAGLIADTASRIAKIRATDEGREGLAAFLEKRQPVWTKIDDV